MMNTLSPSLLSLCPFQDINLMRRNIITQRQQVSQARVCDTTLTIAL